MGLPKLGYVIYVSIVVGTSFSFDICMHFIHGFLTLLVMNKLGEDIYVRRMNIFIQKENILINMKHYNLILEAEQYVPHIHIIIPNLHFCTLLSLQIFNILYNEY